MNYDFISVPTRIQAFQMTRERRVDNRDWPQWLVAAWMGDRDADGTMQLAHGLPATVCDLEIVTLEGKHRVTWDDWIIRGTRGELYPCKPDVFAAKYRAVIPTEGQTSRGDAAQQET